MKKQENNNNNNRDAKSVTKCPKCFGDCYLSKIELICSDCLGKFIMPSSAAEPIGEKIKLDQAKVVEYYYDNLSPIDEIGSQEVSDNYPIKIDGILLQHIKLLQKKYKLGTLHETIYVFLMTMYELSSLLETANAKYIGLINEDGLKSYNLLNGGIYSKTKKMLSDSAKTIKEVDDFITEMNAEFKFEDIKKMYKDIGKTNDTDNIDKHNKLCDETEEGDNVI